MVDFFHFSVGRVCIILRLASCLLRIFVPDSFTATAMGTAMGTATALGTPPPLPPPLCFCCSHQCTMCNLTTLMTKERTLIVQLFHRPSTFCH